MASEKRKPYAVYTDSEVRAALVKFGKPASDRAIGKLNKQMRRQWVLRALALCSACGRANEKPGRWKCTSCAYMGNHGRKPESTQ